MRKQMMLLAALSAAPGNAEGPRLRQALPLAVAANLRSHNGRSPVNFSSDGVWVAHTVELPKTNSGKLFTSSGAPLAEGYQVMQATLSNTHSREEVLLGDGKSNSWGAVFSPDGQRAAFYSDEGGEVGLWIWERFHGRSWRFPQVVARPNFGFELVQWAGDSRHVLCKILPAGMTVKQANKLSDILLDPKKALSSKKSVLVTRSELTPAAAPAAKPVGDLDWARVDLALIDLSEKSLARLVRNEPVSFYAFSPDSKQIAWSVLNGYRPNTQGAEFDLFCLQLPAGAAKRVAAHVSMTYGLEWSWSPDGRQMAVLTSSRHGPSHIETISLADGALKVMGDEHTPSFDPDDGEVCPLWTQDSQAIVAASGNGLWRLDTASGQALKFASSPEWKMRTVIAPWSRPEASDGKTAWVLARQIQGTRRALLAVDLKTGNCRVENAQDRKVASVFNLSICPRTREIVYFARDLQSPGDLFVYNPTVQRARQLSHLNPQLERIELGQARLLDWTTADGQALHGALLLPPGYEAGQRLPLVVWVYGGQNGSDSINDFGLGFYPNFNFHVLATRGYAVLFPDAPIREGQPMADLLRDVMPGVDAAIGAGYADPERLAVMGQSYGSYCTLCLIGQTQRFKAAVTTANVMHPDLIADYLEGYKTGFYERGQGNMHATPWEQRERYLANSPIFLFDKITTPLLMGQGELDGLNLVPVEAIFNALERLHKEVELRLYRNDSHVISQPANVIDFWRRRLDFLAEHLNMAVDPHGAVQFEAGHVKPRL